MTDPTLAAPDWRELCDLHGTNLSDGDGPDTWNFTADQFAAALRDALAATREEGPVPQAPTLRSLLHPHYEPGDGSADGAQLVDGEWWHPIMGCDSLQGVVDNARAVLSCWGGAAVPQQVAESTPPLELLEQWMAEIWHEGTPAKVAASDIYIAGKAAAWARAQAARPAIQPVPESERPWERPGWRDREGRCWVGYPAEWDPAGYYASCSEWVLTDPTYICSRKDDCAEFAVVLPHWSLPLPAADQQEGQGDA